MAQSDGRITGDIRCAVAYGDTISVRPDEKPKEIGGLIMVETEKKVPTTGTVVGIGLSLKKDSGKKDEKGEPIAEYFVGVREGDRIVFSKYAGVECYFNGNERLLAIKDSDIMYIMDPTLLPENQT